MRKIFTFILALTACATSVLAQEAITVGNFIYNFNSSKRTAEVDGTSLTSGRVVIPSSVEYNSVTYTVTAIGTHVFENAVLTELVIPESVTTIAPEALNCCKDSFHVSA